MTALEAQLIKVHGIGHTKARELIAAGLHSISDLRKPNYFNTLDAATQVHIKYSIANNFSRAIATKVIALMPPDLIPVGSYRREKKTLSDLDFLITRPMCSFIEDLKKYANNFNFIDLYMCGTERASMIINYKNINIHVDVFRTTNDEMPYALFHWTGNKHFNIRTRALAKRRGYKLNQHGLFRGNKKIKVKSEKELFDILGVTYKEPWQRNE